MTTGKGFGRRKNPVGKNGTRMLCHKCGSDEHFQAKCPRNMSSSSSSSWAQPPAPTFHMFAETEQMEDWSPFGDAALTGSHLQPDVNRQHSFVTTEVTMPAVSDNPTNTATDPCGSVATASTSQSIVASEPVVIAVSDNPTNTATDPSGSVATASTPTSQYTDALSVIFSWNRKQSRNDENPT